MAAGKLLFNYGDIAPLRQQVHFDIASPFHYFLPYSSLYTMYLVKKKGRQVFFS